AMDKYLEVVDAALTEGIIPRCHLEDITRADFSGFVVPFVKKLMAKSKESGIPVKIRACDTLGYGVPHPQAVLPRSVPKIIDTLVRECGVPSEHLEWHGHNDFHKVLVNGFMAWLYGASAVNGTLLGYGERTGNPPIEGLIIDYISLKKTSNGINTRVITEIADYYRKELSEDIPHSFPFVGSEFNTTRAGIHADGMIKNEEIYNIFDTSKILNRPMGVAITDKSGTAGIAFWINHNMGSEIEYRVSKSDIAVKRIYDVIMDSYSSGRTTALSNDEMRNLTKEYLLKNIDSDFEKLKKKAGRLLLHLIDNLSERDDIKSMDVSRQESVLEAMLQKHEFIQFIYVVDSKGVKVTKNIIDPKFKKDFETKDVGVVYSDRLWFKEPMGSGTPFVSNFYMSRITDRLCLTVSAPIRNAEDKIVGVVGIDISFEELAKI
ncbi:MAG: cache domain-containing protein, partial [Elusimicrobiota bacterium]